MDPNGWSTPCSRRCLLLGAMAAVTTMSAVGTDPATATAAIKISESAVGYQDHPNGDKQCSKCAQFLPPSSCRMVDGTISPQGYCRIFVPRQSAAVHRVASPSTG
jgi:hypothetical protein